MKNIKVFISLLILIGIFPIDTFGQLLRNGINSVHNPDVEIHREHIQLFLVKSDNLFRKGNYLEALNQLDLAVEVAPENPEAYLHRAINDFTKAIEKNNNLAEAYFNRAVAHLLNYNVLLACNDFEASATKGYERGVEKQVYFCNN